MLQVACASLILACVAAGGVRRVSVQVLRQVLHDPLHLLRTVKQVSWVIVLPAGIDN